MQQSGTSVKKIYYPSGATVFTTQWNKNQTSNLYFQKLFYNKTKTTAYWKYLHHYSNLFSFTPSPPVCSSSIYRSRPNLARAVCVAAAGGDGGMLWCPAEEERRQLRHHHHHSSPQCVTGHRALPTASTGSTCSCMMIHDTCYLQWHNLLVVNAISVFCTNQSHKTQLIKQATFDAQMFPIKPKALKWPFNTLIKIDL